MCVRAHARVCVVSLLLAADHILQIQRHHTVTSDLSGQMSYIQYMYIQEVALLRSHLQPRGRGTARLGRRPLINLAAVALFQVG